MILDQTVANTSVPNTRQSWVSPLGAGVSVSYSNQGLFKTKGVPSLSISGELTHENIRLKLLSQNWQREGET